MNVPNKPIGQDPASQMLWIIAKQLDEQNKLLGKLINVISSTTTTTTTAAP